MKFPRRRFLHLAAGAAALPAVSRLARAQSDPSAQTQLKVMVLPGFANLLLLAAQAQGSFAKRGLAIEIFNAPNSKVLRDGLAKGDHQIVHAAFDNAVAMEVAKLDIAVFIGGDSGLNELITQAEIKSYDELRGKTMAVDAPDTAFALLLYKMLNVKGLKKGDYRVKAFDGGQPGRLNAMLKDKSLGAAILSPPFTIRAEKAGLRSLGTAVDVIGPLPIGLRVGDALLGSKQFRDPDEIHPGLCRRSALVPGPGE